MAETDGKMRPDVADGAMPGEISEDRLIEDARRGHLRPVMRAEAYRRLMLTQGLTQVQLAGRLRIGQASIAKAVALLDLPGPIRAKVESGSIAPSTAYELSKVDDPGEQAELAEEAEAGRLKRDQLKERTRTPRAPKPGRAEAPTDRRTIRLGSGAEVVVVHPDGLDGGKLLASLRDALALIEGEEAARPPGS